MDNARIHTSKIFKEYVKNSKINVIYNVPYNPESNPIENIFSGVKIKYKHNTLITTKDELKNIIDKILKQIPSKQFTDTFKKAFNFSETIKYKPSTHKQIKIKSIEIELIENKSINNKNIEFINHITFD